MKISLVLTVVVFALVATFTFIGWRSQSDSAARPALISVDSRTTFQTITGWEATAEVGATVSKAFPYYKKELFDRAVNELGISRVRVEIKSSTENSVDYFKSAPGEKRHHPVNDNANPFVLNPAGFQFSQLDFEVENIVLELKKRLEAKGAKLFINVCYVDFVSSPFEHKEHPEEYAEFVEATYLHLQSKYRLVPDAWEIALEADNGGWSPRQMADAMVATAKRLRSRGFTPRFIAPSTANMSAALSYFDKMIQIPGVLPNLWELSYHRYSGVSQKILREIGNRSVTYHVHTAMLEHIASNDRSLHDDLELGRNSCWQQYTLAYPENKDDGSKYYIIDDATPTAPKIILSSRAKFLRQYFKFIHPGAIRIKATSSARNLSPLAFINRSGKYVVVIEANRAGSFSIHGLPEGAYGIKYTTADQYDVDLSDRSIKSGQQLTANIPNAGVITIYGRSSQQALPKKS
jgi:hypothetical protein